MTTPLIFTGLAVALAFRSGIWNIGVEGQMLMGALAAGIVGYALAAARRAEVPACILAAAARRRRLGRRSRRCCAPSSASTNSSLCLMLNPIALLLTGYVSARVLKAPGPTNKLPDIVDAARSDQLHALFAAQHRHLHRGSPAAFSSRLFNVATVRGFEWKLIGLNPRFANYGGVSVRRNVIGVMLLSGAIAGLAGAEQVLGVYGAYLRQFLARLRLRRHRGRDARQFEPDRRRPVVLPVRRPEQRQSRCCRCSSASANIWSRCCSSWSC